MVSFISDKDYNAICNKSNEALETTKWSKYIGDGDWEEDDEGGDEAEGDGDEIEANEQEEIKESEPANEIALKEFLIETDEEAAKMTDFYTAQSTRLQ